VLTLRQRNLLIGQKMKVFIISLERVRERRLESIRLIKLSGLPFELIDAFDGRSTPDLPRSPSAWWGLKNTEVACYLSHMRALQRIVDYDLPFAIILEDDFEYVVGVRTGLVEIQKALPADFSHLSLQRYMPSLNPEYEVVSRNNGFQKLRVAPLEGFGYIISRELAKHILERHALPTRPIDHLYVQLSRETRWNFYDLVEPIIRSRGAPTTL
jgi:glycosyl transferase family 25